MFWDCLRCGFGTHYKEERPWKGSCPLCDILTDKQAKYILDLHVYAAKGWRNAAFLRRRIKED